MISQSLGSPSTGEASGHEETDTGTASAGTNQGLPIIDIIFPDGLTTLRDTYEFKHKLLHSNAKIEKTVYHVLIQLRVFESTDNITKPPVFVLVAPVTVASKAISITELAKQEIAKVTGKVYYQYTRIYNEPAEQETGQDGGNWEHHQRYVGPGLPLQRYGAPTAKSLARRLLPHVVGHSGGLQIVDRPAVPERGHAMDDEETNEFELMQAVPSEENSSSQPIRKVYPVLVVYLSLTRIPELEQRFGRAQSNVS